MSATRTKPEDRRKRVVPCTIALCTTLVLGKANAELIPIDVDGDTAIDVVYDSTTDLSWMADAALFATNPFGLPIPPGIAALDWDTANAWLAAMNAANYLGVNDWRPPTVSGVLPTLRTQPLVPSAACAELASSVPSTAGCIQT